MFWKSGRFFLETIDNKLKIYSTQENGLLYLLSEFILDNVNALEEGFDDRSENSCEQEKIFQINDGAFEQYLRQITSGGVK